MAARKGGRSGVKRSGAGTKRGKAPPVKKGTESRAKEIKDPASGRRGNRKGMMDYRT